jgi:hypothetical protein
MWQAPRVNGRRSPTPPLRLLLRSVLYRTKIVDMTVGMFIALIGMAMLLYRGGTWWDLERRGHSFWDNFLCDLLRRQTLGGQPNLAGSRLAMTGMIVLVVGIVTAFSLTPELIPSRRGLGKRLAWIGSAASGCLVLSAVLPSDAYPRCHSLAVVLGGVPVLLSFAVFVGALLLEPRSSLPFRALSLILLVLAAITMALYCWTAFFHGPSLRLLPGLERVSNLSLLAWLILLARGVRQRLFEAYRLMTERSGKTSASR